MKYKNFIFVALFLISTSCAVRKTTEGEKVITIEPSTTKVDTLKPQVIDTRARKQEPLTYPRKVLRTAPGFRVQIFAFAEKSRAELAFNDARLRLNVPVYMDEIPGDPTPYKIRVGNFQTRDEAEKYRDFLRQNGYPDAFIVQCEIELP
ncbi:MAG: SPOR domain-containing protein [candidate division WOR-3 bacterium]